MIVPVATVQVGCVIVTVAAAGGAGCAFMTTFAEEGEVHPAELVTVKLYVPEGSAEMVVLAPVPAIPPGLMVQLPAGRPLSTTLPVDTAQVGCVIVPIVGAAGAPGAAVITTLAEAAEVHPDALVTVKL
jgi:hypothetical protein